MIIPNEKEARLIVDFESDDLDELAQGLQRLGVEQVILTVGEAGSILYEGSCRMEQPALPTRCGGYDRGERCFRRSVLPWLGRGLDEEEIAGIRIGDGGIGLHSAGHDVILAKPRRSSIVNRGLANLIAIVTRNA